METQDYLNILAGAPNGSNNYYRDQDALNILAGTTNRSKQDCWNILAGTTGLSSQAAANAWAGTPDQHYLSIRDCLDSVFLFTAPLLTGLGATGKGSTTATFTRASTAYINDYENIPRQVLSGEARFYGALRVHNQFLQSQNFASGTWAKSTIANSTFTGEADPFGGTTAMKMIVDNGSVVTNNDSVGGMAQVVTKIASIANVLAVSIYAKAGEAHVLRIRENTTTGFRAVFDLNAGTVSGYEASATKDTFGAQMTAVGNGWYRCQVRYTTAGSATQSFSFKSCGAGSATTGDGVSGLYLAFAQYEDVTGGAVLATSPYVSNGALSTPWHGANVDGVKYFAHEEIHQQNLIRQSEDLTNATYWSNSGTAPTTIASAGNVGPFGGNATRIVFANGLISLRANGVGATILYGRYYKVGAWVKSNTGTDQTFRLNIFNSLASYYSSDFTATNDWQYFTFGPIQSLGTTGYLCRIANGAAFDPCDILVGGMTCFEDSPYISTEYISNADDRAGLPTPTGQFIAIPSTVNFGYLSEVAATNVCLQSQTFGTTWAPTDTTVLENQTPAPDGTITADRCGEGTAGTAVLNQSGIVITANTTYTASVYIRPGTTATAPFMRIRLMNGAGSDGAQAWFDMTNGTVGTVANVGVGTGASATISTERNGFYRCTISCVVDAASTSAQFQIVSATADNSTTRFSNAVYYLWGAQVESGAGSSSYIPTVAAAVTRNADALGYPGTGNTSNAIGTAYAEATWTTKNSAASRVVAFSGGAGASPLLISTAPSTQSTDGTTFLTTAGVLTKNQTYKMVVTYGGSTRTVVRQGPSGIYDGAYDGDFTAGVTNIGIGVIGSSNQLGGCVRNVKLYSIKISNNAANNMVA